MGIYLNPGCAAFQMMLRDEYYQDKSGLIAITNSVLSVSGQRFICVSRPRRFGKTTALDMLAAYYGRGEDADFLFNELKISADESYRLYLNKFDVLRLNVADFLDYGKPETLTENIDRKTVKELRKSYPECVEDGSSLLDALLSISSTHRRRFVLLIDEWDCLFREYKEAEDAQKKYLEYIRTLLKDKTYIALAYMTGILPIRKYGTHSALNMFTEYTMTDPGCMAPFFGLVDREVRTLCQENGMDYDDARAWYDGYELLYTHKDGDISYSIYNPRSVVEAMSRHAYGNYWVRTETYEALEIYIRMDFDGLREKIVRMLGGESVPVNIKKFNNDMSNPASADAVLCLLIHLGYLSYSIADGTVHIPNREIAQEYVDVTEGLEWDEILNSVMASPKLLDALLRLDAEAVAEGVDSAHEKLPAIKYNDENSLACTLMLAFRQAEQYYTIIREFPSGKGFADLVFIPRKRYVDKPAVILELKWDKNVSGAIQQIKDKRYVSALDEYRGNLILAGIVYDKTAKTHIAEIERLTL